MTSDAVSGRVLVTGGAGFIGGYLTRELVDLGRAVLAVRQIEDLRTAAWEAYLTLEPHPPTTAEALLRNPLGLYVTDLAWSEIVATGESR